MNTEGGREEGRMESYSCWMRKKTPKNWASYTYPWASSAYVTILHNICSLHTITFDRQLTLLLRTVCFSFVFFSFFSSFEKMSQLDAMELDGTVAEVARSTWASLQIASQYVQLQGSIPQDLFHGDGTLAAAKKNRSRILGQICLGGRTTLKSNRWPSESEPATLFWANSNLQLKL